MFRASIRAAAIVCVGLAAAVLSAGAAEEAETLDEVELIPKDRAGWTATNFFAPVTGLFMGGPGYWYSPRRIEIRTTPPDASLDLFYVRRNFQKGYEQADAPARVTLPPRIEAGSRDSLNIRAFADGYKQKEVSVRIRSRDESVMIDLEPLSNSLVALTHLYFAGRSSLELLTKEALTFRVQPFGEGYRFILLQTGNSEAATASMRGIEDALVGSLRPQQLGEDLVLSVELTEQARDEEVEVRQFQSSDAIRRLHSLRIDILPKAGAGSPVQRGREALLRVRAADVTGCALRFDARMREGLDSAVQVQPLRDAAIDGFLQSARAAESRQDYVVAAKDADDALALAPDAPDLLQYKAEIEIARAQWNEAEQLALKSHALGPKVGSLCARNWQTVVEARKALEDAATVGAAQERVQECRVKPLLRM